MLEEHLREDDRGFAQCQKPQKSPDPPNQVFTSYLFLEKPWFQRSDDTSSPKFGGLVVDPHIKDILEMPVPRDLV